MAEETAYAINEQELQEQLRKLQEETKIPNILICGQTGAGKSSVVNYILKDEVALVGNGEPCTRDIHKYKGDLVNIYDSEGYEIGSDKQNHYEQMIFDDFLSKRKVMNVEESVHIIWYTVSGARKRVTDLDKKLVMRMKNEKFPVAVILTKIDELDEAQLNDMISTIKEISGVPFFPVSIHDDDEGMEELKKYTKWDDLVDWTYKQLPDVCKDRFVSALKRGAEEKHKQGAIAITVAATASAGVAVSPIPFSDAALLVPIQTGLVVKLASIYGLKAEMGVITGFVGGAAISNLGKSLAGNLLKFIPAIGTIAGAAINAGVASAITSAIGITLNEAMYRNAINVAEGKEQLLNLVDLLNNLSILEKIKDIFAQENKKA